MAQSRAIADLKHDDKNPQPKSCSKRRLTYVGIYPFMDNRLAVHCALLAMERDETQPTDASCSSGRSNTVGRIPYPADLPTPSQPLPPIVWWQDAEALMKLRHLRYFVAVAEEASFSRAALRMNMAQPPLSQQIRHLEEELGLVLFDRTSRPLRLTKSGRFFLGQATEILARLDRVVIDTQRIARDGAGWLGIGYIGAAMIALLPPVLRRFRSDFPGVEVVLSEATQGDQVSALINRKIHLGFCRTGPVQAELAQEDLYDEPLMLAYPVDHEFKTRTSVAISELANEPFVLHGGRLSHGTNDHCPISLFRENGLEPKVAMQAQTTEAALGLVAAGLGVTFAAASFALVPRAGVHFASLTGSRNVLTMSVAYRHDTVSPIPSAFLRMVRDEVARSRRWPDARLAS